MVRTKENVLNNTLCLLKNIEAFILLDMGIHKIGYAEKQTFKRQLHYALFIIDGKTEECQESQDCFRQADWDNGRELINSENTMEIMTNSFTKHGAMYARVLYSCFPSTWTCITRIDRFLGINYSNSSSKSSSSSSRSSSSSSSDGS